MTTSLTSVPQKSPARITGFAPGADVAADLMELGMTPGTLVSVIRAAPFGDPIEVDVVGSRLALRRSVASQVLVTPE